MRWSGGHRVRQEQISHAKSAGLDGYKPDGDGISCTTSINEASDRKRCREQRRQEETGWWWEEEGKTEDRAPTAGHRTSQALA